jgi:hypothetical protein
MQSNVESHVPPGLDILPVDHFAEYVIGFPMHVAITVHASSRVRFNALPFANFLDLRSCIGIEFVEDKGGEPIRYSPKPMIDPQSANRGGPLAPGESRRMLVDVSPYFAAAGEGKYRVQFSYIETDGAHAAPPVVFRLRQPNQAESAALVSADRSRFPTWGQWTTVCPKTLFNGPIGADNPLRFNLLLQRVLCGPTPLDRVDPSVLDVLTGLYAPEGRALQAELALARGDHSRYEQIRSQLLALAPGLAWWIRMTDGGGAFLKSLRFAP